MQTTGSTLPSVPNATIGKAAPSHESADEGRCDREEAVEAGWLTTVVPGMLEAIGNDEGQLDGDETEDEHKEEHETQFHVAEKAQVHEDEQPQLLEVVEPVNSETPSPPPEAPVEPPASGAQGSSPGIICMTVNTLGGQTIEHRVRDFDPYTIWELKCLVGHRCNKSPYMIELIQQQTAEPVHDNLIVARLPTDIQAGQLSFTAVFSKDHMRELIMLMGECAPDDISMPSLSVPSVINDTDYPHKFRDDDPELSD